MKKYIYMLYVVLIALATSSCDDFINVNPSAIIDEDYAFSEPEKMVTSAYAMLGDDYHNYPFNLWPYGDVRSDDAYKGGGSTGDTDYHALDIFSSMTSTKPSLSDQIWYRLYVAISRCNKALISLEDYGEAKLGAELTKERRAEVLFLRAHFYFKLLMLYKHVPWIDEKVVRNNLHEKTGNHEFTYEELMGKLIKDLEESYNTLDTYPKDKARVSKTAAACYIAKIALDLAYEQNKEHQVIGMNKDYLQKVIDYTDFVIGQANKYGYANDFGEVFMPDKRNGVESIFAVQHSLDDNTVFGRANWGNILNAPWKLFACGWDFHKPSQNLVNAFKTKDGLPMFDTFNDDIWYPVADNVSDQKCDPRLFHTVAMVGFPYKYDTEVIYTYLNNRTPNTYGYYSSLKENVPVNSPYHTYKGSWQAINQNDYVFRYADVMLMRAEALIELGKQDLALPIINKIRNRAKQSIDMYIPYAKDYCEIVEYPSFPSQEFARKALRWERRLEMAMESSRFFDLRRWGIAAETLNAFFEKEKDSKFTYTNDKGQTVTQTYVQYYKDAHFTKGVNEYMPIPNKQMNYIPNLYEQNPGYD